MPNRAAVAGGGGGVPGGCVGVEADGNPSWVEGWGRV